MTTTIIHIDLDAVDERLNHGNLWVAGWGDWKSSDARTCLHGAIRFCQPVKGDAYLIERVGNRFGFGTSDNDRAAGWDEIKAKVIPDITDEMLADTFGPQWEPIVNLVRRAATLTADEARRFAWDADRGAAWDAARGAARGAAWDAAMDAAWGAAWGAAGDAAVGAAVALAVRDLIGQHGFTQDHYDTLTRPWATVIGPAHPDDKPVTP